MATKQKQFLVEMLLLLGGILSSQASQFSFDPNGNLLAQSVALSALPQIIGQPQPQVVMPGTLGSFFVVVADPSGLSYQWRFAGANIGGATTDALLLTNATAANEGLYSVVLSNSSGSVTSAPAALYIDSDGDGLPDSWEIAHFGNLNQTATGDFDGDSVSNLQEFLDGTDPANASSALFRLIAEHDGGTLEVTPSQSTYTNGQIVTLSIMAVPPESFKAWTGDVFTRSNTISLVMTSNKSVFAHFNGLSIAWRIPVDGDWTVATNWLPPLVPGPQDDVTILGNMTVTLNTNGDCAGFIFGASGVAPTLTGTGTLTVHGAGSWTAGTMMGSGRTVISLGAVLGITNPVSIYLASRTLENGGTIICAGTADFDGSAGAVITNRSGALFSVQNAANFVGFPGTSPRFDNAGTFRKSVSTGGTTFGPFYGFPLNNYGTVELQTGTLNLNAGGYNGGAMQVGAGTALVLANFGSGPASSITGAGDFVSNGNGSTLDGLFNVTGTYTINGPVNFVGAIYCTNNALNIPAGTASFNGSGQVTPSRINLTGGTLDGAMLVTVGSGMNWTGGTMSGTGRTIIPAGVTLGITNSAVIYLASRTLENAGTIICAGTADFSGSAGAVITNGPGGFFNVQNAANFTAFPGNSPRFDNAGTFRKSVSTGGTTFGPFYGFPLNNYGTVDLRTGTLNLNTGGYNNGLMQAAAGTVLVLANYGAGAASIITGAGDFVSNGNGSTLDGLFNLAGTYTINGSVNFVGAIYCTNGNTLNIPSGTVSFNGIGVVSPSILNLTGGTLDGAMPVTVGNAMSWTGGTMSGTGRTVIAPGVTAAIANSPSIYLAQRVLENGGTIVWTGAGTFNPSAGAVITNRAGALFSVQNSANFVGSPGAAPRFDNAGTFRKSGSAGTTVIAPFYPIVFNNYGTVDLQSGILLANGGYSCSSNSSLNCAIWGTTPGGSFGQLQVSGTVNLNGTLSINLTNNYVPATNDTFTVLTAGSCAGSFARFIYPSNNVSLSLSNGPTSELVRVTGVTLPPPGPLPIPSGIISWWRAENDALDSISTNHGYLTNGAAFAAGKVGQSFNLDGINDYVVIPDSTSLRPSSVTLEAWVKIFSTNGIELIFAKPIGSGTLDSYGLALQNGVPLAAICDANGFGTFLNSSYPLALGQWYHLAFTFDGSTRQQALYVNGATVSSGDAGRSMAFDNQPLQIGADIENGVPGYFLNGQIDEAAIYNRALGLNEIASLYNVGSAGKQAAPASQPVLRLDRISAAAGRLYWSTNFPGYHLESNPVFGGPNWAASGLKPLVTGTNFVVTNSLSGTQRFYRLSQVAAPYTPTAPTLKIQLVSAGLLRLIWPINDEQPFLLQSSTNLVSTNWASVLPAPAIVGTNNVVTNTITGSQKFYRLSSP